MTEYRNSKATEPRPVSTGGAFGVGDISFLDSNTLVALSLAALSSDRREMNAAMAKAIDAGIPPQDLADLYVPALARQMGDAWCKDEMSFAGVTIGVSRLQSLLRDLGPAWAGDTLAEPDAPTVLLALGKEIYHTLGAMVLAGQLRRKGLSVTLLLGATNDEIVTTLEQGDYDALFLSASIGESLDNLSRMVESVRTKIGEPPPIVIGGTILETETDVRAAIGADHASKDPDEAIALCGLKTQLPKRQEVGQ